MGIDYSSGMGYGFKVDLALLEAWFEGNRESEEEEFYPEEALWAFISDFEGLGYTSGSAYDTEEEFGVVIASSYVSNDDYRDGAFGVFPIGEPTPRKKEHKQLLKAYRRIGTGPIGPIVSFDCS